MLLLLENWFGMLTASQSGARDSRLTKKGGVDMKHDRMNYEEAKKMKQAKQDLKNLKKSRRGERRAKNWFNIEADLELKVA